MTERIKRSIANALKVSAEIDALVAEIESNHPLSVKYLELHKLKRDADALRKKVMADKDLIGDEGDLE